MGTQIFQYIAASISVLFLVVAWISKAEIIQELQNQSFDKPIFLSWFLQNCYTIFLVPWLIWKWKASAKVYHVERIPVFRRLCGDPADKRLTKGGFIVSFVYAVTAWLYYVSLTRTSVATNTIIGNSGCVAVFFLSVWLLKEQVNLIKVLGVMISVGGVAVIALYPTTSSSDDGGDGEDTPRDTLLGLLAAIGSTVLYGLYNVLFAIFSMPPASASSGVEDRSVTTEVIAIGASSPPSQPKPSSAQTTDDSPLLRSETPPSSSSSSWEVRVVDLASSNSLSSTSPSLSQKNSSSSAAAAATSSPLAAAVMPSALFLGLMGLGNLLFIWPAMLIVHYSGLEVFAAPSRQDWGMIFLAGLLDCVMNLSALLAVAWASPLFVSVGSLLSIPGSLIADRIKYGLRPQPVAGAGVTLIVIGFLSVTLGDQQQRILLENWCRTKVCRRRKEDEEVEETITA